MKMTNEMNKTKIYINKNELINKVYDTVKDNMYTNVVDYLCEHTDANANDYDDKELDELVEKVISKIGKLYAPKTKTYK